MLTVLLIICIPLMNSAGIAVLTGSLYSLAVGPLLITDPLSGLQVMLASLTADRVLLLSMVVPIVFAFAFGRVFCGWMCPQNLISEFFDFLSKKILAKRLLHPALSPKPRYAVLAVLLVITPLVGFPVANLIHAPGILSVQVSKLILEGVVGLELALIALIVLFELFVVRRAWCNYVCPVGAVLGIFRFNRTMKVVCNVDAEHLCNGCLECEKACGLGLKPLSGNAIYPLCHNCGACIDACEKATAGRRPLLFRF
jgi:ferredoxin-type protein NapH